LIKGIIQQEDITIINIYAPNVGAPNFIKERLLCIKMQTYLNIIIVGDFNIPLLPKDRSSRPKKKKINKKTSALTTL
jgi:hypothetical protein